MQDACHIGAHLNDLAPQKFSKLTILSKDNQWGGAWNKALSDFSNNFEVARIEIPTRNIHSLQWV